MTYPYFCRSRDVEFYKLSFQFKIRNAGHDWPIQAANCKSRLAVTWKVLGGSMTIFYMCWNEYSLTSGSWRTWSLFRELEWTIHSLYLVSSVMVNYLFDLFWIKQFGFLALVHCNSDNTNIHTFSRIITQLWYLFATSDTIFKQSVIHTVNWILNNGT